ncbi:unnamed protein product [Dimorphilus gyrociliatus]|uniref:Uncharacterized protein n=1 Tax=Dimorphilus gyrociliatus TaxID=2664684 RepID=A0A7I8VIE5_9ANNE|nr:unnamed protein product [Dimorphilus gyrociliatus]
MSSDHEEERDEIRENDQNIPPKNNLVSVKYIGLFSLAVFLYDLSEVYYKKVFPTIENRLVFNGQQIHWVASFVLLTTIIFSFVKQKTKVLGVCCASLAIGNIIIVLPFFIFGLSFSKDDKFSEEERKICHPNDEVNKISCKEDVVGELKGKISFSFLLISRIFISFGQGGLLPLGLSHFYENSKNGWNYLFIGIVICWKTIGSVLAKYLVILLKKLPETLVGE